MTFRLASQGLCLAAAVSLAPVAGLRAEPTPPSNPHLGPHVRGANRAMDALIDRGARRSGTFRRLVEQLNASDVIVYVQETADIPRGLDGRLTFMTSAGGVRYLHVQVMSGLGFEELIAIAGHELQHAVEVASHPEVRDSASLAVLYQRIGIPGQVKDRYDTAAAQSTGRRVRAEVS